MRERTVTIDLVKANVFALVILLLAAIVFGGLFLLIWGRRWDEVQMLHSGSVWGGLIFFAILLLGIVVHEFIHGVTWACFAKRGFKSISYGVLWKYLTPYTHCDEPMHIRPYQLACLMPCFLLGIVPSIVSLFTGSIPWLVFGLIFIAAAAGDIWMTWLLMKENPRSMVLDHPSEAGFYIYDEEESGMQ